MKVNQNKIKFLYSNFKKESEEFLNLFEKEGKNITHLLNEKIKISNKKSNHISRAYSFLVNRETQDYKVYLDKLNFENKINEKKYNLEKKYEELFATYVLIKENIQSNSLKNIEKNTLRLEIIQLNKKMDRLNKIIIVELNSEINQFLIAINEVKQIISEINTVLSIQIHIILANGLYKYKVKDYSELKKLTKKELETGDIILYDEYEAYKKNIFTRQIKYFIKSTILHVAMFYGHEDNRNLIYQATGLDRKVSFIGDFELDSGTRHIILRVKKNLSSEEKEKITILLQENINRKFSLLKLYGIALNYTLVRIYKTWFPFLTTGKNIYFGKGIFCSQTIAEVYQKLGINISNNEDFGMVSPIDIFNSFELKTVGYIEGPKIKT
jgi:hypothetical protein